MSKATLHFVNITHFGQPMYSYWMLRELIDNVWQETYTGKQVESELEAKDDLAEFLQELIVKVKSHENQV